MRSRDALKKKAVELKSNLLMEAYQNLRNKGQKESKILKNEYFSKELDNAQDNIKRTWGVMK